MQDSLKRSKTAPAEQSHPRHRRRGSQLESELLDAAWDELAAVGFSNLTMDSVATRARTGIAVLYRRWSNKDELVIAAIEHYRLSHTFPLADTGNLREDLVGVLTGMGQNRSEFSVIAWGAAHAGLMASTGLTPTEMRERFFGDLAASRIRTIYQRAHDRGEIDQTALPPALLAMPFDLVRHDLIMDRKAVTPARIRTIVDDLLLPLIQHYAPSRTQRKPHE